LVLLITGLLLAEVGGALGAEGFAVGDIVRVAARTVFNVRDNPSGNSVGTQPNNAEGAISGGPHRATGPETWWQIAWRVSALGVDYLLPHPIGGGQGPFETTDGFLVEAGGRQPANLLECLPAVLRRHGNSWEIQEAGKLG